jgi:CRP/FNR family transcriptional regulator, cyclic AMP receptor protein
MGMMQAIVGLEWSMDEVLAGTVLFQGLPADAAERLGNVAERRKVTHGDVIFRQGEPGASMYVILRGKVRMTRPADPGRDNLLTLLGPGDLFGELTLFDPAPRRATATAITDVELAEFTAAAMKSWLAAEPDAAWHFLRLLARRLRRVNDTLENLLYGDVPRRVARTLLDMAGRFGQPLPDGTRVHHDLTQEQLAQHIGASRESVNKALSELAARSIIRLEPKTVIILDLERLKRKAGLF